MPKKRQSKVKVGIDVGKFQPDVAIHEHDLHFSVPNDSRGVREVLSRLAKYTRQSAWIRGALLAQDTVQSQLEGHIMWEVLHRTMARLPLQRPRLILPYREFQAIAVL